MTLKALAALLCLAAPASASSLAEVVREDGRFTTLLAALDAAGLTETIAGDGTFTLYAPSDEAFAALPSGTVETLLLEENRARLVEVLTYHLDDRILTTRQLPEQVIRVRTVLEGTGICIARVADGVTVTDATGAVARVTEADIRAENGVIHALDRVLLPGGLPRCQRM
ncbi:fasciclin domain-containing protein [Jannaschia formosa]|uniref:fasciclin domain-containing protein n=1 Tax=Jannaschia formosa TaxID=2259592 RepID=UPI000E1C0873|nr:fasciclin domain-containing protein [Jannaschia formosa]TFL17923.1 fasciclin domain-containing protein [Jannaschia formosa]